MEMWGTRGLNADSVLQPGSRDLDATVSRVLKATVSRDLDAAGSRDLTAGAAGWKACFGLKVLERLVTRLLL